MSDKVLVTARKDDEAVWQRVLDRDAYYFQRFREMMEVDLDSGRSITITPLSDLEALALGQDELPDGSVSSVVWSGRPG